MRLFYKYFAIVGFIALVGCTASNDKVLKEDVQFKDITNVEKEQIKDVIYNMPSPMQAAMMLKDVGAIYMSDVMNPVENEENYYGSNYITALNLGIYGADLGYACVYMLDANQAFDYLRVSKSMAKELGILGAFEYDMVKRFDENMGSRDSLMTIVGESFELTDKYLKENKRSNVSAMIVAGSWIEGLYLSTKVVEKYPSNMEDENRDKILAPITQSIAEQKPALKNLLSLLEVHKDNDNINKLIGELKDLDKAYAGVKITQNGDASASSNDGMTTIGNDTNVEMPSAALTEITIIIDHIRNSLTKVKS